MEPYRSMDLVQLDDDVRRLHGRADAQRDGIVDADLQRCLVRTAVDPALRDVEPIRLIVDGGHRLVGLRRQRDLRRGTDQQRCHEERARHRCAAGVADEAGEGWAGSTKRDVA